MTKKNRKILVIGLGVFVAAILIVFFGPDAVVNDLYTVQVGEFESTVLSKGEMKSQNYTKINMPDVMTDPNLNVYRLEINDLVEEGTIVSKGDYVATLDQESIKSELNDNRERLQNRKNRYKINVIDSATSLTEMRNEIQELKYDLEYKLLEIKQSIYESKSYQEKIKRSYDKAIRKLETTERNYQRETMKYEARCENERRNVENLKTRVSKLELAIKQSRIKAPSDGMIIYATVHGRKRSKGDRVSFWSPEIAVLPDLSKLISEGYIEEIYISKVHLGDKVRVKVDALPEKTFTGVVVGISNIGKTVNGVDNKVFDIKVRINESDKDIAHGMNTSNEIISYYSDSNLIIPIEHIFVDDKGSFVYLKVEKGFSKRYITITHSNDEFVLVTEGISEGDQISTQAIQE